MKYTLSTIDPRPASRESELERITGMYGLEVTQPHFRAVLDNNIDEQHTDNGGRSAIEVACTAELPQTGTNFVTSRVDADSIGAKEVFELRAMGVQLIDEIMDRVQQIAIADAHEHGEWDGTKPIDPIVDTKTDWTFQGLNRLITDFKRPLGERCELMREWLKTGTCEGLDEAVQAAKVERVRAYENSKVEVVDGIASVVSTDRFATGLAYCFAPVGVCTNPAFAPQGGDPVVKHTVSAFNSSYIKDWKGLLEELNEVEAGWGGNIHSGIIGSPQGQSSVLSNEQVSDIVRKYVA